MASVFLLHKPKIKVDCRQKEDKNATGLFGEKRRKCSLCGRAADGSPQNLKMFPVGQHPCYPYTEKEKQIVLENVGIKEAQLKADAEAIRDWVQKQPHLAEAGIDSHAAGFYVLMAKGSVEIAKQRIDFYYRERARSTSDIQEIIKLLKDQYRPVFDNHCDEIGTLINRKELRSIRVSLDTSQVFFSIMAPVQKLYNGSRVTFTKIIGWETFKMEEVITNMSILAAIRFSNDFTSGDVWIIDTKNVTLGDILKLNFMALSRAYWILREGTGLRLAAIYVVNFGASGVIQACLNILKQFLSKKMLGRVQFHETSEALHEILPKEYLLEDYGGDLPSYEVYRDKMEKMIADEKTKRFLLDACKVVSDESKRPKSAYNEEYLPGNFKKLDLD